MVSAVIIKITWGCHSTGFLWTSSSFVPAGDFWVFFLGASCGGEARPSWRPCRRGTAASLLVKHGEKWPDFHGGLETDRGAQFTIKMLVLFKWNLQCHGGELLLARQTTEPYINPTVVFNARGRVFRSSNVVQNSFERDWKRMFQQWTLWTFLWTLCGFMPWKLAFLAVRKRCWGQHSRRVLVAVDSQTRDVLRIYPEKERPRSTGVMWSSSIHAVESFSSFTKWLKHTMSSSHYPCHAKLLLTLDSDFRSSMVWFIVKVKMHMGDAWCFLPRHFLKEPVAFGIGCRWGLDGQWWSWIGLKKCVLQETSQVLKGARRFSRSFWTMMLSTLLAL